MATDHPVCASVSAAPEHIQESVAGRDEKHVPIYLATTASMRAMTLPTKQYVKRESRLPPHIVLRKRTISSTETSEEGKKVSSGRGKSISSSPERMSLEALMQ